MIFEERSVRDVLLSTQVEPLVAAQVASALHGTMGANTQQLEDEQEVQFDGLATAEQWPAVFDKLSHIPPRLVQIDEFQTAGGNVEYTVRVREIPITDNEAEQIVTGLRFGDDSGDERRASDESHWVPESDEDDERVVDEINAAAEED